MDRIYKCSLNFLKKYLTYTFFYRGSMCACNQSAKRAQLKVCAHPHELVNKIYFMACRL